MPLSETDALAGERAHSRWATADPHWRHSVMATQGFRAGWAAAIQHVKEQNNAE